MISNEKLIPRAPEVHKVPGRVQGLPARVGHRVGSDDHHQFDMYIDDDDDGNDNDGDGDDDDDDDETEGSIWPLAMSRAQLWQIH